jgi:hypothetical protein
MRLEQPGPLSAEPGWRTPGHPNGAGNHVCSGAVSVVHISGDGEKLLSGAIDIARQKIIKTLRFADI